MHGGVRILCLPSIDSLSFIFVGFSNAINLTSGLDKVCGMNENTCMTDKELFFITALPARLALSWLSQSYFWIFSFSLFFASKLFIVNNQSMSTIFATTSASVRWLVTIRHHGRGTRRWIGLYSSALLVRRTTLCALLREMYSLSGCQTTEKQNGSPCLIFFSLFFFLKCRYRPQIRIAESTPSSTTRWATDSASTESSRSTRRRARFVSRPRSTTRRETSTSSLFWPLTEVRTLDHVLLSLSSLLKGEIFL